jgi:hypothetical protein
MHGDDDRIVMHADSGPLSAKFLKNGTLKTHKGFPHGVPTTEAATINADLLALLQYRCSGRLSLAPGIGVVGMSFTPRQYYPLSGQDELTRGFRPVASTAG